MERDVDDSENYSRFLRSLDDNSLIDYVSRVSQRSQECSVNPIVSPQGMSTPLQGSLILPRSLSSDPFDDGLDSVLLNVNAEPKKQPETAPEDDSTDEDSVGEMHEFGDYATYFRNKGIKQQNADAKYVKWDKERRGESASERKNIFEGCVVHVNGNTVPTISEIHRLVILHGGKFISYLTNKGAATHIICDRLTPRKRIQFKNYKVVRAQWILDSIARNELLNWQDYRLIQEIDYGQQRLELGQKEQRQEPVQQALEERQGLGQKGGEERLEIDNENPEEIKEPVNESVDEERELENEEEELPLMTQPDNELDDFAVDNAPDMLKDMGRDITMDAKHPDFLQHFFAYSRLHHLSSWKANLRLKFLTRIVKEKKTKPRLSKERVILHIDFDCFFATASCLKYPGLDIEKDPIAVSHGGKTSDVASCNYAARSFGVRNGMWLRKALGLCPNLQVLSYDFEAYEQISDQFYNYLISNDIFDVIFPVSIDEVLIDATSYCLDSDQDLSRVVNDLASKIRKDIYALTKCPVSVGASRNVLLAKLSLRKAKPNNQFFLNEGVDEFLSTVRVEDLPGIGRSIRDKLLNELNTSNTPLIKDLLGFDLLRLKNIFGAKTGAKLYDYARGIDPTTLEIDTSNPEAVLGRKSISVDVNYGIRFDTMVQLEEFLMRLSKELYSRLVSLGVCGSSVTLRLAKRAAGAPVVPEKHMGMGICEFVSRTSRLGVATNDWGVIGSELKVIYRTINVPVKDLRGISVTMTKLENVDSMKKNKQRKLNFARVKEPPPIKEFLEEAVPAKQIESVQAKQVELDPAKQSKQAEAEEAPPQLTSENIDWSVFESLPVEIRSEIQAELERRGLTSANKMLSPRRKHGKTFLQQLIPSQPGAAPRFRRVRESPTRSSSKSPTKKQRTVSPVKKTVPVYDESDSYSTTVLNELPSSIGQEVLKEVEIKKKSKKFNVVPLRDKISAKHQESRPVVEEVTSDWIAQQPKLNPSPSFMNQSVSFKTMKVKIDEWIAASLHQKGPHDDDMAVFVEYLRSLLAQKNVNRCLLLVEHIKKSLAQHESINRVTQNSKFVQDGINDWYRRLETDISSLLETFQ